MICRNGVQLAGRCRIGDSIVAKQFFSLFYQLNQQSCPATTRSFGSSRNSPLRRRPLKNAILPTQRASFFWWHPTMPVTEEIYEDEATTADEDGIEPAETAAIAATAAAVVTQPLNDIKTPTVPPLSSVSQSVRHLMRHLPAPIVVLTTNHATNGAPGYHGMTLSSFTTLSLSPDPIISFNIRTNDTDPSRTLTALTQTRHFLVHILEESTEGARIADVFTKGRGDLFGNGEKGIDGIFRVEMVKAGEEHMILPMLSGSGVGRVLRCEVMPSGVAIQMEGTQQQLATDTQNSQANGSGFIRVGDHVLVIARVLEILGDEPSEQKSPGLSYMDGKYRRAGTAISLDS